MLKNNNICIIPARGGSKRIPKKNIKKFCGKPILAITIDILKRSKLFEKIVVSSDDLKILKIAKNLNVETHHRNKKLSNDYIGIIPVVKEVIRDYKKKGEKYKRVCCVFPTSIFFKKKNLLQALKKLKKNKSYIFTAAKYPHPIERSFTKIKNKLKMNFIKHFKSRTQTLPASYYDAAQFYFGWEKSWLDEKNFFSGQNDFIELDPINFQDIDEKADWKKAIFKWKKFQKN